MSKITNKRPVIESGQCRCCGGIKRCRLLNVEYEWFGQKEVYTNMFLDCFGLLLSNLDGEPEERLICATCVTRLREAFCFRNQVLKCEEKLLHTRLHGEHDSTLKLNEEIKQEGLKEEIFALPDQILDDGDIENSHEDLEITIENISPKRKRKKSKLNKNKDRKLEIAIKSSKVKKKIQKIKVDVHGESPNELTGLNSSKSMQNLYTIVENSFAQPFDTSFSDYFCIYCREIFTDPNKLREHSLAHDPKTFKDVYVANKKLQLDIFRIDCRLCSERIEDLDILKEHLVNSHEKVVHNAADDFLKFRLTSGTLTCLECNANFNFFHALKKHMAEHFGSFICDICGAHYFEERMLAVHQKTHKKVDEYFQCKECGKTFKSKYTRYIHVARMHKKEAAYQCSKCDEAFFSSTIRYRHMIEAHGLERMYQCEQCDRAYDSRKSLREHCRRFHLKIQKHQCDLCDKRFYLPSRLKEHMVSHTGERNFRCECCGKSYPRLRGLKVHMQSHIISDKKYKCTLCNASYTQNANLKNHLSRQHQNIELNDSNFNNQ
ncbi:zinc finger protein 37-like [Aricia agestis]|uniref:zinc finger protein 37-like n=1 Tax=Aricia agestis TaxID=91739 RepID=UPI001C20773D|nr:zinc finger protein 37-like [Aricia agestis]